MYDCISISSFLAKKPWLHFWLFLLLLSFVRLSAAMQNAFTRPINVIMRQFPQKAATQLFATTSARLLYRQQSSLIRDMCEK